MKDRTALYDDGRGVKVLYDASNDIYSLHINGKVFPFHNLEDVARSPDPVSRLKEHPDIVALIRKELVTREQLTIALGAAQREEEKRMQAWIKDFSSA